MTLTVKNTPPQAFLVALDMMGVARPDDTSQAYAVWSDATSRVDYEEITGKQGRDTFHMTAIGAVLAQYISLSGPFGESGEFDGTNGYTVVP